MRSRVPQNRRDVRHAMRLDIMVGLYSRGWIRKGRSGGPADEEQVRERVGTVRGESQVLVCSRACVNNWVACCGSIGTVLFLAHVVKYVLGRMVS